MYGNENSYFRPNTICRFLTYVYDSTYFIGAFFNNGNYKNLGHIPKQKQQI